MTARVPAWLLGLLAVVALAAGLVLGPLAPWASGAPGEDSAEAGFARDMRAHHAQAVTMSLLAFDRSTDPHVRALAADIATTQQGQIGRMGAWLEQWGLRPSGQSPPMAWMDHEVPAGQRMPGMAGDDELRALEQARGTDFDRLFAELMHTHHRGGLPMTEAVLDRTDHDAVRALATGMRDSQQSELAVLAEIAARSGGAVDDGEHAHH